MPLCILLEGVYGGFALMCPVRGGLRGQSPRVDKQIFFEIHMNKHVYFKHDQQDIIQRFNLQLDFEANDTTCIVTTVDDIVIIVLSKIDDGTILQKWSSHTPFTISNVMYTKPKDVKPIDLVCEVSKCNEISNNNNLKCYMCEINSCTDIEDLCKK